MTRLLTCKDLLTELNAFLDNDADPDLRNEIQRHINECPNCWVVVDTTQKTLKVYKNLEPQDLPPEVHDRLMEALSKKISSCG